MVVERLLQFPTEGDAEFWLDRLRQQGQLDSSGRFTVDLQQAQRKLRHHLSSEPTAYLSRLARAAVRADAPLSLERSRRTVVAHCPALLSEPAELEQLWQSSLQHQPLAQAVMLALDLQPARLEICLAGSESFCSLRFEKGRAEVVRGPAGGLRGTCFRLSGRQPTPEIQHLRQALAYCPLPLYLNGKLVQAKLGRPARPGLLSLPRQAELVVLRAHSAGRAESFWADHPVLQWRFVDPLEGENGVGLREPGHASIVVNEGQASPVCAGISRQSAVLSLFLGGERRTLQLLYLGELIEQLTIPGLPKGVEAVVDASHLTLELGGDRLVKDEEYEALLAWVRSRAVALQDRLFARYPGVKGVEKDYRASLVYDCDSWS